MFIFLSGNKVLLLKRSKKNIFFSFDLDTNIGKIKDQEGPDKAVIRETIEETSLKVKDNISFLCSEKYKNDNYWFYYSYTMTAYQT